MPTCICLRDLCGDRFRITHDESYAAERSNLRSSEEPWLQVIRCQSGHIFPHGGDLLAFSTDRRGSLAGRLRRLPYVEVIQDADDGVTVLFPVSHFDEIAAIVRPRRRRILTDDQKARLAAQVAPYRFPSRHAVQIAGEALERAQTPLDDQGANPNAPTRFTPPQSVASPV